jgi:hypothetical protein
VAGRIGKRRFGFHAAQPVPASVSQYASKVGVGKRIFTRNRVVHAGATALLISGNRVLGIEGEKAPRQASKVWRLYFGFGQINGADQDGVQQNRCCPEPEKDPNEKTTHPIASDRVCHNGVLIANVSNRFDAVHSVYAWTQLASKTAHVIIDAAIKNRKFAAQHVLK